MGRRRGARRGHRDPARGRPGQLGRRARLRPAALDERLHGAVPAAYKALDLLDPGQGRRRSPPAPRPRTRRSPTCLLSEELRSSLYSFDLVQRRAKRPAGAPDKGLARDVTKVGIVGAGLMASQLALLFARRLEVPVVLTDLDQARVDKGVGYVHAEIDKAVAKGRLDEGTAAKLRGLVTGAVDKAAFADADFVIEAVFEDLTVKKQVWAEVEKIVSPETRAGDQHLVAVGDRDGRRAGSTRSGSSASTSSTRSRCCRCWRSSGASGPTTPRLATAFAVGKKLKQVVRAGHGRPGVRGQPAAHPLPRRDLRRGRRGHAARGGRRRAGPAGPADAAVGAAAAGRPGRGAPRGRDPARGVPGPVRGQREPQADRRLRSADHGRRADQPRGGGAARRRRPAAHRRARCGSGRSTRWRRRSG